jgi:anaerobic selenocysteine-containing dehydrogenase
VSDGDGDRIVNTFCRVCEPMCALVATVRDGRLTTVVGDKSSPYSHGHFCNKATGAVEVMYDAARITQPQKRVGKPDEFVPVSWSGAMSDIVAKLSALHRTNASVYRIDFLGVSMGVYYL